MKQSMAPENVLQTDGATTTDFPCQCSVLSDLSLSRETPILARIGNTGFLKLNIYTEEKCVNLSVSPSSIPGKYALCAHSYFIFSLP